MSGKMAKTKGAEGERELAKLLQKWAEPVTEHLGVDKINLERMAAAQSKSGGYDLSGLSWLAIEVKRVENMELKAWWRQTLKQCNDMQIPFLAWRLNRKPWNFRTRVPHQGVWLTVDLDLEAGQQWFQRELYARLTVQ